MDLAAELGLQVPLVAAPMAGGATTPALVAAARAAGGLGFVAAGYRPAADLEAELASMRATGGPGAAGEAVAVNLFAPNPVPVAQPAYDRYAAALRSDADALGVDLPAAPREDDDGWSDKLDVLLADPVAVVSCTFGLPPAASVSALQRAGTLVLQTVTSADEAVAAAAAGVDGLVVQSSAAGGHWGTFDPGRPSPPVALDELVPAVLAAVDLPVVAAGGVAAAEQVAALVAAGAAAVAIGTLLLLADEAGTHPTHRAALESFADRPTVLTRAFTGRPARGLRNQFIERHDPFAPLGYPALHHLTAPLRRAAAAAGDAERLHLWAGTGVAQARAEPLAATFARLGSRL